MLETNTQETGSPEKQKKNNWLIALVILLILLLVGQSAAVIFYLNRRQVQPVAADSMVYPSYVPAAMVPPGYGPAVPKKHAASVRSRLSGRHDPLMEDAFDSMNRLEDNLNRMVARWMAAAPTMSELFSGADAFDFMPTMDLEEKGSEYIVKADLPGLDKNKIDITVKGDLLTLQGVRETESETEDEQSGVYKQERSYGSFARSLRLPGPVDETKISADYQNGVLTIHLPKEAGAPASKKIEIQ